eukprot:Awhi_evm1s670
MPKAYSCDAGSGLCPFDATITPSPSGEGKASPGARVKAPLQLSLSATSFQTVAICSQF